MNLRQLRYICAIAEHRLNVSRAAEAMSVVQPAVSRQVMLLEQEIGATIFVRKRKRIVSVSKTGEAILKVARRIIQDVENIKRMGAAHRSPVIGDLTIATTHTHARYSLPSAIERYSRIFPSVRVTQYEGNPDELSNWLANGTVDISIAAQPKARHDNLTFLPLATFRRVIVVPPRHKLLKVKMLTLARLAEFPIITFHPAFPGGDDIPRAFRAGGIDPYFRVMASNTDVIKTYVRRGLGIGIISPGGLSLPEDRDLRAIDASHLFPPHRIYIGLRKGHYLQEHAYEFLKLVAPDVPRAEIEKVCGQDAC